MHVKLIPLVFILFINTNALALSLELALGETEQAPLIAGNSGEEVTENTFTFKASYEFHPTWNIETAYEYYAQGADTYLTDSEGIINEAVTSSAIFLGLRKSYILTDRFAVNVRLGYSTWNINYDIEFEDHAADFSYADSGSTLYWGLGAEFYFTPRFYITAGYTQLTMEIRQPEESIQSDNISNLVLNVDSDRENEIGNLSFGIGYIF